MNQSLFELRFMARDNQQETPSESEGDPQRLYATLLHRQEEEKVRSLWRHRAR